MGAGYLIILFCLLGKSSLAQDYRLSKNIVPDLYDIHIKPYLQLADANKQFTFDGHVNITLHAVSNNVKTITLHKNLIEILSAMLYDANGKYLENIYNDSLIYDSNTHKLTIDLKIPLEVYKNYTLHFKYLGQIRNGMEGFYRASNDNVTWYGITQLHRIDARTVFPCFDEPEFKAKFRMHISRTKEYNSFFNTLLMKSTNDGSDRVTDHFEETPLMSTYLVAFLITDFESNGNEDIKIIMHRNFNNKTRFAFEAGLKALNALDNYTQMPYKSLGNKIMQMVGTNNFPHSGMENWGLVFYKEATLAQEPGYTDDWSHKQNTISLVVHETSHMWFGNSVTHKWWSYFWLNEALPNYYQYFIAHEMYPEYEFDKQFLVNELHVIFDFDATSSTQPLTSPENSINTPLEIGSKFSNIAYAKGASIIRMFKNLMGKEYFDMAIREYLKQNFLKTVKPHDLFKQLKKYWPGNHLVDLDELFKDWTEQVGYPIVNVSRSSCGRFSVTQQRFLLNTNDGNNADLKYTIPITLAYDKRNDFTSLVPEFYLMKNQKEKLFGNATLYEWVVINKQQSNYYRVFYDTELLKKLGVAFKNKNHSGIHVNNRAGVVDDLFTYARSGLRAYDEVFAFIEYLALEVEYIPWQAAFKGFETIYQRLTWAQHNVFGEYLYEILNKVYQKLGFGKPNDSVLDIYLRNKVIAWLCKYHHENCNTQAQTVFNSYMSENNQPSPDFRETLYCAALRNDNEPTAYGKLKEMFLQQELPSEKEKILRALGCTRYFLHSHYEFILTSNVALDLKAIGLKSLYSQTPENIMPVFNLIIENVEQLAEVLKDWSATGAIITDIAQYLTTPEQLILLQQFTKEKGNLFNSSISALEYAIAAVENNLKWSTDHLSKLLNYLTARNSNYRLTKDILPASYDIHFKAYLKQEDLDERYTFEGEVNITIQAKSKNLKKITLHKKQIKILKAILYDADGNIVENITSGSMLGEPLTDKHTVYLLAPLGVNNTYILYFKYQGQFQSDLAGLFRATYDEVNWYGITQLQRIDARTVFPCFDEPSFKAKFRMHINRPQDFNSFFNTRLTRSTIVNGTNNYVDHFEETPVMSTYLVAFLISDFESYGNKDFKFIVHSKFKNKTYFAYEVGLKTLAAYDNYTQLPYKSLGNSIIQNAASRQFPYNGMENWGLVMYRDAVLIHEPGYTDGWSDRQYTVTILSHEISHMWFGNSVTFKWWSYFWLNEAFARYYQYFLTHEIYPEYQLDQQFVVKQVQLILDTDATNNTQPLTSPEKSINTPAEIGYKSSGIAYAKGAAIVRMFANLMGQTNYHQAIREYLKENHLKNVEPEILFEVLKKYWPQEHMVDLDEFFRDWTEQVGYPVVSVSVNSNGKFTLTQKRFLFNPNEASVGSIRYTIPITFNSRSNNNYSDLRPLFYFNKTLEKIEFGSLADEHDWLILNAQQSNYFRVFYSSDLLGKLREAFVQYRHAGIHVSNRANIIDDLFTYGRAGLKGYDEVFEFMQYLATETEYTPWYAAFKGFHIVYIRFTLEQHQQFGRFLYKILAKVYQKLDFENPNDTILDIYNRNQVIQWLCKYHHEDCNTKAKHIFQSHITFHTKPTPDFRETLYCAACRNGDSNIYNNLRKLFETVELANEREKILRAMGCTRYYVESHYDFISSNNVPLDLKVIGFSSLYTQTPENIMTVFKLMIENVEMLAETLQSWSTTASVISNISNYLTTEDQLNCLEQFIQQKGHLFGTSIKTLEDSVKSAEENLKWATTHLNKLFIYLNQSNSVTCLCSVIWTTLLSQIFTQICQHV